MALDPVSITLAVIAVISAGASYVQAKKAQKKAKELTEGVEANIESNSKEIPVVYGKRRVGGVRVYIDTSRDKKHQYLYMVLAMAEGEVESITDIKIDDISIEDDRFNYDGLLSERNLEFEVFLGSDGQEASTLIGDGVSYDYDRLGEIYNDPFADQHERDAADPNRVLPWSSKHKLSGIAYLALKFKWDEGAYTGIPDVTAVVKGRKVYDPRTGNTAWSDNPALCIRDYLTNERFGKGLPASAIDDVAFSQAANDLDSFVAYPYQDSPSYQYLFRMNHVVDTSKKIMENLNDMIIACRGFIPYSNGVYSLKIDQTSNSVLDIGPDQIISGIAVAGARKEDRFNQVKVNFFNASSNYKEDQAIYPEQNSTLYQQYLAEDEGEPLVDEIDLYSIDNYYSAREMARLFLERSRQNMTIAFQGTSELINLEVGEVVSITHPTPAWTNKLFQVQEVSLAFDGTVQITCIEYDAALYTYDTPAEEQPYVGTRLPDPNQVDPPTALSTDTGTYIEADGKAIGYIDLSWSAPEDSLVDRYEIKFEYSSREEVIELASTEYRFKPTQDNVSYVISVRAVNGLGIRSAWLTAAAVTSVIDTTAPSDITGINISAGLQSITLDWTNPSEDDFDLVRIKHNTVDEEPSSHSFEVRSDSFVHDIGAYSTTKHYWLAPVDRTGNVGNYVSGGSATTGSIDYSDVGNTPTIPVIPEVATTAYLTLADNDAPTDTEFSTAVGRDPIENDFVVVNKEFAFNYNGTAWVAVTEFIDGSLLVTGSLSASDITTGTLNANDVTISNLTVSYEDLGDKPDLSEFITAGEVNDNVTVINGGIIQAGSAITVGTVDNVAVLSGSDATYRLWAGDASSADAPFKVSQTGVLYATGAEISGNITAGSIDAENITFTGSLIADGLSNIPNVEALNMTQSLRNAIEEIIVTKFGSDASTGYYDEATGSFDAQDDNTEICRINTFQHNGSNIDIDVTFSRSWQASSNDIPSVTVNIQRSVAGANSWTTIKTQTITGSVSYVGELGNYFANIQGVVSITDNPTAGNYDYRFFAGTISNLSLITISARLEANEQGEQIGTIDLANYSALAQDETITGNWTFSGSTSGIDYDDLDNTPNISATALRIVDSAWAGGTGHVGYNAPTGNSRFGFSAPSGRVDVYADGNFYATDSSHKVYHAGDFTNNSSNWDTAYTYSQVGHLPLTGGTLTGELITTSRLRVDDELYGFTTPFYATEAWRGQAIIDSRYSDIIIASREANSNTHGSTLTFATQSTTTDDYAKIVINQGQYNKGANLLSFSYGLNQTNPHTTCGANNANSGVIMDLSNKTLNVINGYQLNGSTVIDGSANIANVGTIQNDSVWINDGSNYNNYNENIRLFDPSNDGPSVIAFGAVGTGGIPRHSILSYDLSGYGLDFRVGTSRKLSIQSGEVKIDNADLNVVSAINMNGTEVINSTRDITATSATFSDAVQFEDSGSSAGRLIIEANNHWSNSTTKYPNISGSGTGEYFMMDNPHINLRSTNARSGASYRAGIRCASTTGGNWWDIGLTGDQFEIYRTASASQLLSLDNVGNLQARTFKSTIADTTPKGTPFSNVFKGDGTYRTAYFDGNANNCSVWWGVGNNPHAALDSGDGKLEHWVNTGSTWNKIFETTTSGITVTTGSINSNTVKSNGATYGMALGGYSLTDTDETSSSVVQFGDNRGTANWDEFLIKGSSARGVFGRTHFGIHTDSSKSFAFHASSWATNAEFCGDGRTYLKGPVGINYVPTSTSDYKLRLEGTSFFNGEFTAYTKRHNFGHSANWDEVGFTKQTNVHFQGHNQFWVGAGNGTWFYGTANNKNYNGGLSNDASAAHDLLITTMRGTSTYDRGITFAVDSTGSGNAGWRLGKWHSGTGYSNSLLAIDGNVKIGGGNNNEPDYYYDDYSAYHSTGRAGWQGDSGYGWHDPSLTVSNALQIQSSSITTSTAQPQIQFHQYGYGGPKIEYNGPSDILLFKGGSTRLDWVQFDTTGQSSGTRINYDQIYTPVRPLHIQYSSAQNVYIHGNSSLVANVGIGASSASERLHVHGNIVATGNITAYYSDMRLKDKIGDIENALDIISQIETLRYKTNELGKYYGFEADEEQIGVSAQSVQKVLPQVVKSAPFDVINEEVDNPNSRKISKSGKDYITVQYDRLVPVLIEAIKELKSEIEELKNGNN